MVRSRRNLILALSLCCAASCAYDTEQPPDREHLRDISQAGTACPGANVVEGIDVSQWQAGFDFNAAKAKGKHFAIIRASHGLQADTSFDGFYPKVKAAGMIRGVYQYFVPTEDTIAQADLLIKRIGGKLEPGDLPPTLDVEKAGTTVAQVKKWLDYVESKLGVKPMIYTGFYFWRDNLGDPQGFADHPLWIAGYVNCPQIPNQWSKWTFWQYSDSSGKLDVDKFNGTLAQLQALTQAQQPDYAAKYVSQTHPVASKGPIELSLGQTVKGSITMKNVGKLPWKAGVTKFAPIPRDKASQLKASTWLSDTRVSTVGADVPPGADGTFAWDLTGNVVGDFDQFFGFVHDGTSWFADPPKGGGPADNVVEVKVRVSNASYRGQFLSTTYPLAAKGSVAILSGKTVSGSVVFKNTGTQTWKAGVTKLAPTPRDKACPFKAASWLSPTRVSSISKDVPPGAEGSFSLDLYGAAPGTSTISFSLIEDGVTWFADPPKGGGPSDKALELKVQVSAAPQPDASTADVAEQQDSSPDDASDHEQADTGEVPSLDGGSLDDARQDASSPSFTTGAQEGGCHVSPRAFSSNTSLGSLLVLSAAALLFRRRQRLPSLSA